MKDLNYIELPNKMLKTINGGGLFSVVFTVVHYTIKYTSITGAVLTGLVEGISQEIQEK